MSTYVMLLHLYTCFGWSGWGGSTCFISPRAAKINSEDSISESFAEPRIVSPLDTGWPCPLTALWTNEIMISLVYLQIHGFTRSNTSCEAYILWQTSYSRTFADWLAWKPPIMSSRNTGDMCHTWFVML